jgi:DNA polymerase III subunit beta
VKFRCERDVLLDALTTAGRAVSSRGGSLPVLSGLLVELTGDNLRVTGSDLDLTITVERVVSGERDGVAVLPAKLASDIVRSFKAGAVHFDVDGDQAQVSVDRSDFSLRLMPADEYPRFERAQGDPFTIESDKLSVALKQVVPAASSDDSRPILTGVLMAAEADGIRFVATDSYRLAVRDISGEAVLKEGQHVLVPSRALNELTRTLHSGKEVNLLLGQRDASFSVGGVQLSTRLIEGEFPNYRGLIPKNHPNKLTVDRDSFLDALRRVRLMAQEATPVRVAMRSDGLELIAITQDIGQAHEDLDAEYDGQELTVAFNPQYLLDGVEVCAGEKITLETVDALKPAVLRSSGDDEFLYLLMPVRVS